MQIITIIKMIKMTIVDENERSSNVESTKENALIMDIIDVLKLPVFSLVLFPKISSLFFILTICSENSPQWSFHSENGLERYI